MFTSVRIRPVTPKIKVMEKTLRFFKQDNKWYDVFGEHPEHIYITKIESK